jgi:hypothetical protein
MQAQTEEIENGREVHKLKLISLSLSRERERETKSIF